jgi:hypothetical protein
MSVVLADCENCLNLEDEVLYFLIHYWCDNTRKVRSVRERHTCIGLMKSNNFMRKHNFLQLNLSSVEHL